MATKTASKAGLRAAATARTDKAAQRTPLPPKNLRENIALAQEAVEESKPQKRVRKLKAVPDPTPAAGKADKYAAVFTGLGWESTITRTDGLTELVATRGTEALYLAWMREAHVSGTSTYTIQDRTVKVRNPAEATRIAGLKPEEAAAKQVKVASNRQFRKRPTGPTIRTIPFDVQTATEAEIRDALEARRVSWHNSYSVSTETATVGNAKFISVQTHREGHRIVSFVDPETGYRAFRLDRLENVGRKVDIARIKQQIIASLSQGLKKAKAA